MVAPWSIDDLLRKTGSEKSAMRRLGDNLRICLMSYRGNPYCGGQGIYVQYLAHELVKLGHEVSLMVGPPYPFHLDGARELRVPNNIYFGSSRPGKSWTERTFPPFCPR